MNRQQAAIFYGDGFRALQRGLSALVLSCLSCSSLAESADTSGRLPMPLDLSYTAVPVQAVNVGHFDDSQLTRLRYHAQLRVNGWQLGNGTYVGQTKVGGQWGLGMLIEQGDHVYGINHRGVQWLKRF